MTPDARFFLDSQANLWVQKGTGENKIYSFSDLPEEDLSAAQDSILNNVLKGDEKDENTDSE